MKAVTILMLMLPVAFGQAALTTAQIAKRVAPSVVVIQGKTDSGEVSGSGFIISKDGRIVTNLHVIRDLRTAQVQLENGESFNSISVLATDERHDLAVIHIAGFDLPALDLGNSNTAAVGEPVVVVGNPQGLHGTVTAGILSSIRDGGDGFKVLQTDAAVNPGNSGGPLVNGKGQVIGVVSFKLRSSEGLNFAVPINDVRGLLTNLHDPTTLNQMRRDLTADQPNKGASLKETLDWLKATIPLATTEFSAAYSSRGPTETTSRTVPVSFASCTVALDQISTDRLKQYSDLRVVDTTRYSIPLGALDSAGHFKWKPPSDLSYKGETWVVSLHSTSKVILSEAHDGLADRTKNENLSDVFLTFNDETVAERVQDAFSHATELCRGSAPTPTVVPDTSGPSFKETLEWLREKLPLAANHYIVDLTTGGDLLGLAQRMGRFKDVTQTTAPIRFDSCTVVFDVTELSLWEKFPKFPDTSTSRFTVPLGAITKVSVAKDGIRLSQSTTVETWIVTLTASSKSVLTETRETSIDATTHETLTNSTKSQSMYVAILIFYDESIANRVSAAFKHAAELCRGKEPFCPCYHDCGGELKVLSKRIVVARRLIFLHVV